MVREDINKIVTKVEIQNQLMELLNQTQLQVRLMHIYIYIYIYIYIIKYDST